MSRVIPFSFPLSNGLHARPASNIEEAVHPFQSAVVLLNRRNGRQSSARSVLGLAATDTQYRDPCELRIQGGDEDAACEALTEFLERVFPACDTPLQAIPHANGEEPLPRSLTAAGLVDFYRGQIACPGLGWGRIAVWRDGRPGHEPSPSPGDPARERASFRQAATAVEADLWREIQAAGETEKAVLKAHVAMLRDPALTEEVSTQIERGKSAAAAVESVIDAIAASLGNSQSLYLRERILDLEDLGSRLLDQIEPHRAGAPIPAFAEDTILIAKSLTPSRLLRLDRGKLRGLVLGHAGATSHTVILARSFGIPTLTGLGAALLSIPPGQEAILDGQLGLLIPGPGAGVRRFYERERTKLARFSVSLAAAPLRCVTADGRPFEVAANIATGQEAEAAFTQGADGIGLLRTEMLFMARAAAPGEDEQAEAYGAAVRAARGQPVIIRLLDIGGDKPVPYLHFPKTANPFHGCRGVRWYADHAELVKTQLRALVRAAAEGPLKILVPMVSSVEEIRICRRLLAEAHAELSRRAGPPPASLAGISLGIMLEVPSVAFAMDRLSAEADFFSLGTNDLAHYFFATDRGDPAISTRSQGLHPSFLRLLQALTASARLHGRWIGMCGALAEDSVALPLLVGLGLDEISVAPPRVRALKLAVATLDPASCRALLEAALACATVEEVLGILDRNGGAAKSVPLLDASLVLLDSESRSKEEAIREMADALHLAGRTESPERIEGAVWQRESAFSTGFGEGFALPHCRSGELSANSMVVARFRGPIPWGSVDGQPVEVAVLLAARADDSAKEHLSALARFSRLVLQDSFRAQLRTEQDPHRVVALIQASLAAPRS